MSIPEREHPTGPQRLGHPSTWPAAQPYEPQMQTALPQPPHRTQRKSRAPIVVLAVIAALTLMAGTGGAVWWLTRPTANTAGNAATAPTAGCAAGTTEELYVQTLYTCPDGTRIVTFASSKARDDYLNAASHFGAVVVEKGETWARIRI
jgi:hypothetical protein